jgi:peptidoglycan/xylan/chitin deacetylase (PgdA/CDA1 family)
MVSPHIVFLMYHELELPGRKFCQSEPGYVRYILALEAFRHQLERLKQSGFHGLNVSEAMRYPSEPSVCITFDDGCETDLLAAAPALSEFGFHATFYLTAGFLGTPGYMNAGQVRELGSLGFEIGCHSMTHAYLSDLAEPELKREIVDAKAQIEQMVGHSIDHFSCPGGRFDRHSLDMARRAGFRTVANSLFHANSARTNPYDLGRVAILRSTRLAEFSAICHGRGLWRKRIIHNSRRAAQGLLGNRAYDRLRATILRESKE